MISACDPIPPKAVCSASRTQARCRCSISTPTPSHSAAIKCGEMYSVDWNPHSPLIAGSISPFTHREFAWGLHPPWLRGALVTRNCITRIKSVWRCIDDVHAGFRIVIPCAGYLVRAFPPAWREWYSFSQWQPGIWWCPSNPNMK